MTTYIIERRIANTNTWRVIDHASSHDEAIEKATRGDRKYYAGVRITPQTGDEDVDAYARPKIVVGV